MAVDMWSEPNQFTQGTRKVDQEAAALKLSPCWMRAGTT